MSGVVRRSSVHILSYTDATVFILARNSSDTDGGSDTAVAESRQYIVDGDGVRGNVDHDLKKTHDAGSESLQSVQQHCFPPWNRFKRIFHSMVQ